jgi:hypothetical protein
MSQYGFQRDAGECTGRMGRRQMRWAGTQASEQMRVGLSDIHEGASVKTGARRDRDFPNLHSASPASAERQEIVCGCSPSHRRRRTAPCRTPGCNLSPAPDLDKTSRSPSSPHGASPAPTSGRFARPVHREASGGPGGEGPKPAVPSPQEGGLQAPPGPPEAWARHRRPTQASLHSFTPTLVFAGGPVQDCGSPVQLPESAVEPGDAQAPRRRPRRKVVRRRARVTLSRIGVPNRSKLRAVHPGVSERANVGKKCRGGTLVTSTRPSPGRRSGSPGGLPIVNFPGGHRHSLTPATWHSSRALEPANAGGATSDVASTPRSGATLPGQPRPMARSIGRPFRRDGALTLPHTAMVRSAPRRT